MRAEMPKRGENRLTQLWEDCLNAKFSRTVLE